MKPKIGITSPLSSEAYTLRKEYPKAVSLAGGLPLMLPYVEAEDINRLLESVDGILLTGGGDVNPKFYGEEAQPEVCGISDERDIFELALCKESIARGIPMLCICRGMQILNVSMGGTLAQHIKNHQLQENQNIHHGIKINPSDESTGKAGTLLFKILGEVGQSNSRHHQAVAIAGQGAVVCAYAPDGVIEAIEIPKLSFAIGVQWHPEDMIDDFPLQLRLFEEFIKAATKYGDGERL